MKPLAGQRVKVMFGNGVVFEGVVRTWTDQESVLAAHDGGTFIILKTKQDVLAVKVQSEISSTQSETHHNPRESQARDAGMSSLLGPTLTPQEEMWVDEFDQEGVEVVRSQSNDSPENLFDDLFENSESEVPNKLAETREELQNEFNSLARTGNRSRAQLERLADLRKQLNEIDREEIRNNLTSHEMMQVQQVQYGVPNFNQKSRSQQYPAQKDSGKDISNNPALSRLLRNQNKNNR